MSQKRVDITKLKSWEALKLAGFVRRQYRTVDDRYNTGAVLNRVSSESSDYFNAISTSTVVTIYIKPHTDRGYWYLTLKIRAWCNSEYEDVDVSIKVATKHIENTLLNLLFLSLKSTALSHKAKEIKVKAAIYKKSKPKKLFLGYEIS